MNKKPKEVKEVKVQKSPFIYRSIFNFWLAFILPTGLMVMAVTELYQDGTIQLELLRSWSPWISGLLFQVIFGFLMYVWLYIPAVKEFKNNSERRGESS